MQRLIKCRAARPCLGWTSAAAAVAMVVCFIVREYDPDNRAAGPVLLVSCFLAAVPALAWLLLAVESDRPVVTPDHAAPVEGSGPVPVKAITPEPLHHRPSPGSNPRPRPTVADTANASAQVPRQCPPMMHVQPEWDYGRETVQLRKMRGVLVTAGVDVRALADLVEIDTMAGETLCVNDESAVDPEAVEALRRISRKLRGDQP